MYSYTIPDVKMPGMCVSDVVIGSIKIWPGGRIAANSLPSPPPTFKLLSVIQSKLDEQYKGLADCIILWLTSPSVLLEGEGRIEGGCL